MSRSIVNASSRDRRPVLLSPALLFVTPALILLLVFSVLPTLMTFVFAWTDQRYGPAFEATEFVGLRNFSRLLEDDHFWMSLQNTLVFAVVVAPIQMLFGLMLALLVHQPLPGMRFFRALFFIPSTTSFLVIAVAAFGMLQPNGLLEHFLKTISFGLLPAFDWSGTENKLAEMMVWTVWQGAGFEMLIFLAALQTVPKELHEAAALDGANPWQHFRFVTLGFLRNASVFVFVTTVVKCLQLFDQLYAKYGGYFIQSSRSLVYTLFEETVKLQKVGYGCAYALVVSALILIAFVFQRFVLRECASQIPSGKETRLEKFWNAIIAPFDHIKPNRSFGRTSRVIQVTLLYAIAVVCAIFFVAPIMYLFSSALKTDPAQLERDFNTWRSLLPIGQLGFENLWQNLRNPVITTGLTNSLLIVGFLLPLNLLVNGVFAYALARFQFRLRGPLTMLMIVLNFVPFAAQAVPLLLIVSPLGWTSSLQVQIVPFIASALSSFLFYQFFLGFPRELEDAASIDGANWWHVFWRIVVPLSAPVFSTVALLTFFSNWGNFFWPVLVVYDNTSMPIALSIMFAGPNESLGVILALPALILFLVSQRWFIRSITSGAINE
jgi:ABC-type sugar transport system permease subunit